MKGFDYSKNYICFRMEGVRPAFSSVHGPQQLANAELAGAAMFFYVERVTCLGAHEKPHQKVMLKEQLLSIYSLRLIKQVTLEILRQINKKVKWLYLPLYIIHI